jgi:hypothetical protein
MLAQKCVIEHPILGFEALQERVLANIRFVAIELRPSPIQLVIDAIDPIWKPAIEIECLSFLGCECGALVETRTSEQSLALDGNFENAVRRGLRLFYF